MAIRSFSMLALLSTQLLLAGALDLALPPPPLAQSEAQPEESEGWRLVKWLALFFVTLVLITGGGLAIYKLRKYLRDEDIL